MAPRPRGGSFQASLAAAVCVALVVPAAGSRRAVAPRLAVPDAALCRPACGPGGLCLPTRGLGKASWRCHCRHPWRGPACLQLAEDASLRGGGAGDEGARAAGGGGVALEQDRRRQLPSIPGILGNNSIPSIVATDNSTTTTTVNQMEDISGRETNDSGDMEKFLISLVINSGMICGIVLAFSVLRRYFPMVYGERLVPERMRDDIPEAPKLSDGFFSWFWPSCWTIGVDDISAYAGLDHAMYIAYTIFAMKLMVAISVPFWIFLVPLHICCGGGKAEAIGDTLSMQGLNNVVDGNWLWKLHAFVTYYVTLVTILRVRMEQEKFADRRMTWLKNMDHIRATTLMIEDIPNGEVDEAMEVAEHKFAQIEESLYAYSSSGATSLKVQKARAARKLNTSNALATFLNTHISPSATRPEHVYIVKKASALKELQGVLSHIEACRQSIEKQEQAGSLSPLSPSQLSEQAADLIQLHKHKSREELLKDVAKLEIEAANLRADINRDQSNQTNSTVAFVRFAMRRDAVICLKLFSEEDNEEIVASMPKGSAEDIIWTDLSVDEITAGTKKRTGFILLVAVFMTFAPLVMLLVTLTKFKSLESVVPQISEFHHFGKAWDGLVGTTMLTLLMGQIPTLFKIIFTKFFVVKDFSVLQLRLQQLYYPFLVVFVMFLTSVGSDFTGFALGVLDSPATVFVLLADTLPDQTHFFINYFHSQWFVCALQLLRIAPLLKFISWSKALGKDSKAAKEKAEPEDQSSQGMGARSALASLNMTMALTLCCVSPLVPLMALIYFAVNRTVYGYLFTYAESLKGDMGGDFFVNQLYATLYALVLYVTFMTGLIYIKTKDMAFTVIAMGNFYVLWEAIRRMNRDFRWEIMEFSDLESLKEDPKAELLRAAAQDSDGDHYRQPELRRPTGQAQAALIVNGTRLQAAQDACVWMSPESWEVLRKLEKGDEVRAAGPVRVCAEFPMVPLVGGGAVEIDYLHIAAEQDQPEGRGHFHWPLS